MIQTHLHPSLHRSNVRWKSLLDALSLSVLFINLAFPKGGFYLSGIPLTWGYLALGAVGGTHLFRFLTRRSHLRTAEAIVLSMIATFGAFSLVAVASSGVAPGLPLGYALSYLVSTSVVPILSLLLMSHLLTTLNISALMRVFRMALAVVAVFGLAHFAAMNFLDAFIGIPYLTLTGGDLNSIAMNHINRGSVFKLVSTYNNGNILGVNVAIWFPLLAFGAGLPRWLGVGSRAIFLLSLSRTVWIGWLFLEAVGRVATRRRWKDLLVPLVLLPAGAGVILGVTAVWFDNPLGFLLDKDLGGRADQFVTTFSVWPSEFKGVLEVVYPSILESFGLLGLLLFVVTWALPLAFPVRTHLGRAAKVGLFTYLILMLSDGAFLLIPTQFTYWMVAAFVLHDSRLPAPAHRRGMA